MLQETFRPIGQQIRAGRLDLGRQHYALSLMYGVAQAMCLGIDRISALEFGVWKGGGQIDLHKAATFLEEKTGVKTDIYGFDTFGKGLGKPQGHVDHPEIWSEAQFELPNPTKVKNSMPEGVELVIGDVSETVAEFKTRDIAPIGFAAIDVDYYTSTPPCLEVFQGDAEKYVPVVPMHVNDIEVNLVFNSWCGEALAISEFNAANEFRKIEKAPQRFLISRFFGCHVLDHPVRTGAAKAKYPLKLKAW